MPPRKNVNTAPPTVVVRRKAVKLAPRAVPTSTELPPTPAPTASQSPRPPVTRPTMPTPAAAVPQPKTSPSPQPVPQPQAPALEPPPSSLVAAAAGPSKTQQEKQARRELLDLFRARWPQAFPRDFRQIKPLALGIRDEIAAQLPAQPLVRLRAVIGIFQRLSGAGYLLAVLRGGPRYALDGSPRGEVTPEEQALAKRDLAAFYERRKAQRQATKAARAPQALASPAPAEP